MWTYIRELMGVAQGWPATGVVSSPSKGRGFTTVHTRERASNSAAGWLVASQEMAQNGVTCSITDNANATR